VTRGRTGRGGGAPGCHPLARSTRGGGWRARARHGTREAEAPRMGVPSPARRPRGRRAFRPWRFRCFLMWC